MRKSIEIPVETAAALVMACTAIEDITDELKHIQPYLDGFMEMA